MNTISETVKGGKITREAATGRLVSVETEKSKSKVNPGVEAVMDKVTDRWADALERLADR